jgi:hypothetical protein
MNVTPTAATVPMMGLHWIDPKTPELNGKPFTTTFIVGSWDGRFVFYEPMITKATIESVKSAPKFTIANPVNQPAAFERPGYHPTQYSISWDAAAKEYRISLDALVKR